MSYQLRSRALVTHLEAWLVQKDAKDPKDAKDSKDDKDAKAPKTRGALLQEHPRVKSLPGLLRRNGLLQTVLFLQSKGANNAKERLLWQLLESQLGQGLPFPVKLTAKDLAELLPQRYLFLQERAIEIAILLSRLLDAQAALEGS